jgi:hypothetical protein
MRAVAIVAGILLIAVSGGCGSGGRGLGSVSARYTYVWQAASHLSSGCARRAELSSNSWDLVFARGGARPLVYYYESWRRTPLLVSSQGGRFSLIGEDLWPCRTPVAMTRGKGGWMMTRLASDPSQRKTIPVGRFGDANWVIAPSGRFLFFDGQTIQYAGAKAFTPRGLPAGWSIQTLAPSPRDPSVFIATVSSPTADCRATIEPGAAYLITPGGSRKLREYNECTVGSIRPVWAPDGRAMLWAIGTGQFDLYLSDARGRHLRKLVSKVCAPLWSPDGKEIAYERACAAQNPRSYVLDFAGRTSHLVGEGRLEAWSPDGKELALSRVKVPWYSGTPGGSVVIMPVSGGPAHTVIRWAPSTS